MTSPCCPFADISTVLSVIYDIAQQNSQQLDLHQMLAGGGDDYDDDDSSNNQDAVAARMHREQQEALERKQRDLASCVVWAEARNLAGKVLTFCGIASPSEMMTSSSNTKPCDGPFSAASQCCPHVSVVAATFAACKFVGIPHIAFVTLDAVATSVAMIAPPPAPSVAAPRPEQQQGDNNQQQQQQNFKNLFVESDDDNSGGGDGRGGAPASYQTSRYDVELHDKFVNAVVKSEAAMMKRCGYFSLIEF